MRWPAPSVFSDQSPSTNASFKTKNALSHNFRLFPKLWYRAKAYCPRRASSTRNSSGAGLGRSVYGLSTAVWHIRCRASSHAGLSAYQIFNRVAQSARAAIGGRVGRYGTGPLDIAGGRRSGVVVFEAPTYVLAGRWHARIMFPGRPIRQAAQHPIVLDCKNGCDNQ
jgi:hypothetical protein